MCIGLHHHNWLWWWNLFKIVRLCDTSSWLPKVHLPPSRHALRVTRGGAALLPINSPIFTRPHNPAGPESICLLYFKYEILIFWLSGSTWQCWSKLSFFWPGFSRPNFGNVRGCDTFKSEFRTVVRCLVLRYACVGVVWFNEFVERDCRMGALLTADWIHLSLFARNGCNQGRDGCSGIFHWTLSLACGCVPLQAILFFPLILY